MPSVDKVNPKVALLPAVSEQNLTAVGGDNLPRAVMGEAQYAVGGGLFSDVGVVLFDEGAAGIEVAGAVVDDDDAIPVFVDVMVEKEFTSYFEWPPHV